jgi:hypothetical protein
VLFAACTLLFGKSSNRFVEQSGCLGLIRQISPCTCVILFLISAAAGGRASGSRRDVRKKREIGGKGKRLVYVG